MEVDTKIPNAATFAIEREDHTLGNILRGYRYKKRKGSRHGNRFLYFFFIDNC